VLGLVAAKERVLGLVAEKRRALITRAVTRGLDPYVPLRDSGIPWLGEIPAHWELKRAKWLFNQSALPVRDDDEMVTCFRDGQVTLRKNRREEGFTNAIKSLGTKAFVWGNSSFTPWMRLRVRLGFQILMASVHLNTSSLTLLGGQILSTITLVTCYGSWL
jgi:hypothetical protein